MRSLRSRVFWTIGSVILIPMLLMGCRPSVQDVVKVIDPIPIGASRDEVRKVLIAAYSKRFPRYARHSYALMDPPLRVTKRMIDSEQEILREFAKAKQYARVHPAALFEASLPSFRDKVGLVAEASEGNGTLTIYYDSNTNYIGFFACSTAKVKK